MNILVYRLEGNKYKNISLIDAVKSGYIKENKSKELVPDKNTKICEFTGMQDIHGNYIYVGDIIIYKMHKYIATFHIDQKCFGIVAPIRKDFIPFNRIEYEDVSRVGSMLEYDIYEETPSLFFNRKIKKGKVGYSTFIVNYQLK